MELFDFGIATDGAFYYVMELLDGLDADSLLRRFGPTPPERAIYLLRQVCHSLSEAHSCGLVHRDIKPANIFLCRYGEEYDFVKVLDFGIVGTVRDAADPSPMHTRENAVHGTPAFIAPEQAMGTDVDGRADTYATGCVACWVLTGQFVFTAETPMGLLLQHAQRPPTPPSARTELPIPRALDDLVLSCLAKDLANRRSPPDNCRFGWQRWKARPPGPRTARGSGGQRTSPFCGDDGRQTVAVGEWAGGPGCPSFSRTPDQSVTRRGTRRWRLWRRWCPARPRMPHGPRSPHAC